MNKCVKLNIDPLWFQEYFARDLNQSDSRASYLLLEMYPVMLPRGPYLAKSCLRFALMIYQSISGCLVVQYADDTQLLLTGDIDCLLEVIERDEHILSDVKIYFQKIDYC